MPSPPSPSQEAAAPKTTTTTTTTTTTSPWHPNFDFDSFPAAVAVRPPRFATTRMTKTMTTATNGSSASRRPARTSRRCVVSWRGSAPVLPPRRRRRRKRKRARRRSRRQRGMPRRNRHRNEPRRTPTMAITKSERPHYSTVIHRIAPRAPIPSWGAKWSSATMAAALPETTTRATAAAPSIGTWRCILRGIKFERVAMSNFLTMSTTAEIMMTMMATERKSTVEKKSPTKRRRRIFLGPVAAAAMSAVTAFHRAIVTGTVRVRRSLKARAFDRYENGASRKWARSRRRFVRRRNFKGFRSSTVR